MKRLAAYFIILSLAGAAWQMFVKKPESKARNLMSSMPVEKPDTIPLSANCNFPRFDKISFESVAISPLSVASHSSQENAALSIALEQVKFARGYYQLETGRPVRLIPFAESDVKILKVDRVPYGQKLLLDNVPKLYNSIPQKLVGTFVTESTPALKVTYAVSMEVMTCNETGITDLPLILPRDPYLAYWYLPEQKRMELTFGQTRAKVNPCGHAQIAEMSSPKHYWYVWKPEARQGNVDCRELLREGKEILKVKVSRQGMSTSPVDMDFHELKETKIIKIVQIFGYGASQDSIRWASQARKLIPFIQDITKAPKSLQVNQDVSTIGMFDLVKTINGLAKMGPWTTKFGETFLELHARGKFHLSGKEISVSLRLGPTTSYQTGEKHWEFLESSLKDAHFIFYSGHADMGKAFDLSAIKKLEQVPDYQFFGIMSCFANSYFEKSILNLRSPSQTTDLLTTAYEGKPFMISHIMLTYLDARLAQKTFSLHRILEEHFGTNEIVVIRRL